MQPVVVYDTNILFSSIRVGAVSLIVVLNWHVRT